MELGETQLHQDIFLLLHSVTGFIYLFIFNMASSAYSLRKLD